jgi:preprotein translocase subunit SecE
MSWRARIFKTNSGMHMQKDDATWLNIAYLCTVALIAFVFWKAFTMLGIKFGWQNGNEAWFPVVVTLGSIALGVLITFLIRHDSERHEYLLSSIAELRKVTWPTWENTKKLTLVVCIVVAIFSVVLTIFDLVWAKILKLLLV